MQLKNKIVIGFGIAALAVPAAAVAEKGGNGHGHGKTKAAQYNVKGVYAGDGVVSVKKANGHARKAGWRGTDVTFDLSGADIRVEDNNLDGVEDLSDVPVGAPVHVKARLPKGDPGAGPFAAQRLVDKTEDVEEEEPETEIE